jgi:dTDP-4-dehydrorhamnose 3,5-epimerase
MFIQNTTIPGVLLLKPDVFEDDRGFFMESYQAKKFADVGIVGNFVQDSHSGSKQNTLRGLHYQIQKVQTKLVRAVVGEVFDVAVDIRRGSPTFGKWFGARLSAENKLQLLIPVGFAHGYYVLSDWAEVVYKVTDFYAPDLERSILWNDPQLGITWPLVDGQEPTLSNRDRNAKTLSDADLFD